MWGIWLCWPRPNSPINNRLCGEMPTLPSLKETRGGKANSVALCYTWIILSQTVHNTVWAKWFMPLSHTAVQYNVKINMFYSELHTCWSSEAVDYIFSALSKWSRRFMFYPSLNKIKELRILSPGERLPFCNFSSPLQQFSIYSPQPIDLIMSKRGIGDRHGTWFRNYLNLT